MWGVLLFVMAVLVSVGAAVQTSGPSLQETQEVAQAQVIRRIAISVAQAARVQLIDAPGADLSDINLPATLPNPALYGRRDLFLPYSALVPGGHDWLPTPRASIGAALPALEAGAGVSDPRAYEVGVLSCKKLRADPDPGGLTAYRNLCPVPYDLELTNRGRDYHLLVIKAGWQAQGGPTPVLNPQEINAVLRRDFGQVWAVRVDAWRTSAPVPASMSWEPQVDSFVVFL